LNRHGVGRRTGRGRAGGAVAGGAGTRGGVAPGRRRLPRIGSRGLAAVLCVAVAMGCGWLWLRSSSLVRITQIRLSGVSGPDAGEIRATLIDTARQMTTLDLSVRRLESAVSSYSFVRGLRVSTGFPHAVEIRVREQVPTAVLYSGGARSVVDSDGQILAHASEAGLPSVPVASMPSGGRLGPGGARDALAALAAAPYALLPHIQSATTTAAHGIVIQVRRGPQIYFGGATALRAKWEAALAVLGSASSQQADYVNVTDPNRPAAGAG
jgi:cell division protein FtsQ